MCPCIDEEGKVWLYIEKYMPHKNLEQQTLVSLRRIQLLDFGSKYKGRVRHKLTLVRFMIINTWNYIFYIINRE